jgi:hypothetical protein
MMHRTTFALCLSLATAITPTLPCGSMTVEKVNPVTGRAERVCVEWDGHDHEVYWYERDEAGVWSARTRLTDNAAEDVSPQLAFDSSGGTGVAWRESRAGGVIRYRGRSGSGEWQDACVQVSAAEDDASAPSVVFHEETAWVGWHELAPDGEVLLRGGFGTSPQPWPLVFDLTPPLGVEVSERLDLEIKSEHGRLWLVWADSPDRLGYSEWNEIDSSWGATRYETFSGESDRPAAKERVRAAVLQ